MRTQFAQTESNITLMTTDPLETNQAFVSFYKRLYQSDYPLNSVSQNTFLDGLSFPNISVETKLAMKRELNFEDISNAILNMKGGKASGPDGIPMYMYTFFNKKLITPLLNIVAWNHSSRAASPLRYKVT